MLGSNFANSPMAFSHWKTQFSDNGVQSYNEVGFELSGKTWSTSQDRMLLYAAESLQSKNWRRISIFLGGLRSPTECLIRWKTIRAGALWTPIQDRRLRNVVMKLDIGEVSQVGISTWAIVALMVGHGRSAESCYDRWDSLKGTSEEGIGTEEPGFELPAVFISNNYAGAVLPSIFQTNNSQNDAPVRTLDVIRTNYRPWSRKVQDEQDIYAFSQSPSIPRDPLYAQAEAFLRRFTIQQ